jgi:hypothetical protein
LFLCGALAGIRIQAENRTGIGQVIELGRD